MSSATSTIGGPDREVTVHEAHDGQLPPLRSYLHEMWVRRRFVVHMARSNLKATNADTVFGQLWQVLNPLLLGVVYYLIVTVIRRGGPTEGYFVHLLGALFLFFYLRGAMATGANSVVAGGSLLLNSAFPRAVLPLASTMAALFNYLPTFLVYLAFHVGYGNPLHWTMLLLPLLWLPLTVFAFGMSMLAATLTVYFRDTASFLPYVLRIWMYLSPVLLTYDQVVELAATVLNGGGPLDTIPASTIALAEQLIYLNPMMGFLQVWSDLVSGVMPDPIAVWSSLAWAVLAVVVGGWYFLTHEREFAFRV